jgi:hypothetical protein
MRRSICANILQYGQDKQWPRHLSKKDINMHLDLIKKIFHDKEGLLLVQLTDYNYTRMVLLLPRSIKKKPSAKHTIASLEVMMLPSKRISRLHPPITGWEFIRMSKCTCKHAPSVI